MAASWLGLNVLTSICNRRPQSSYYACHLPYEYPDNVILQCISFLYVTATTEYSYSALTLRRRNLPFMYFTSRENSAVKIMALKITKGTISMSVIDVDNIINYFLNFQNEIIAINNRSIFSLSWMHTNNRLCLSLHLWLLLSLICQVPQGFVSLERTGQNVYLWSYKVSTNDRRRYLHNVSSHRLTFSPYSATDGPMFGFLYDCWS